jgi:uncharacterized damage-inducible protein DinB
MKVDEKREIIAGLESGRTTLVESIRGVTEEAAQRRTDAGRWSILECMEHIAIAEEHMFSLITTAAVSETAVVNRGREALIRKRGADRSRKFEAPDVAKPNGRFRTLDDATQHFLVSRHRTMDFVDNCESELRAMMTTHPLAGEVNCYEMLLLMSAHPIRHSAQIAEIRNT